MTCAQLPIAPKPRTDEALSSWVERIAMFYGGDYELGLGTVYARAGRLPLLREADIDTDAHMRDCVCAWTGAPAAQVPAIIDAAAVDTLPRCARLSYCPACWDEDVAAGHSPYWRRRWARWSVVHCERHRCWLTAKRPSPADECHVGWAPLWSTRTEWASSFELRVHQPFERMLVGFEPSTVKLPDVHWNSLSADLVQFEQVAEVRNLDREDFVVHRAILNAVRFGPLESLTHKIDERIVPESRCTGVVDEVRSRVPLWHGTRVILLLIAVEYLRIAAKQPPVNPDVATIVRNCSELSKAVGTGGNDGSKKALSRLSNRETSPHHLTNDEIFRQYRAVFGSGRRQSHKS